MSDVTVKPLKWSTHPAGGEQAAAAGLGLYRVHANGDDWYLVPDHMGGGGKSSAQADYEQRIRSAIVPANAPGYAQGFEACRELRDEASAALSDVEEDVERGARTCYEKFNENLIGCCERLIDAFRAGLEAMR